MATLTLDLPTMTDHERWQAVLDRDRAADGRFILCVQTTGIYCRPTCPARRPLRQNVHFADSAADARRQGYRPCKRCQPDDPTSPADKRTDMIAAICQKLEQSEERLSLQQLATEAGMSRFHFHRVFRDVTGVTPKAYETALRAKRVRASLESTRTVTQAVYDAGFASNGQFYATTNTTLGMTPKRFRLGGEAMTIHVAFGTSFLGIVLVAATEIGICSIMLGDSETDLRAELDQKFPNATIESGDSGFRRFVDDAVRAIAEPETMGSLPLDIRGTAFQQRVWQELRRIPSGSTVSYGELAANLGSPRAARAVAAACSQNPIAVAIPCHRVVGKDGSLTGYRWGIERKRQLLEHEASA